ncbi:MAG: hypothetical protein WCT11_00810 [Candidatus Magasanikbacteria bacterium]|jgi:predicted  nucleic acid-binding Zn-ribbon protein
MDPEIKQYFEKVDQRMDKTDQRFDELMDFLSENMATKTDLANSEKRLEEKFNQKIETEIANLNTSLSQEIRILRVEVEQVKWQIEKLEKRMREDSDVLSSEVLDIKKRIDLLERRFNELQPV